MFDGGDGIADQRERAKYFGHGEATKAALAETIRQNPIGLSSIVQGPAAAGGRTRPDVVSDGPDRDQAQNSEHGCEVQLALA
jgi:hypothetical protein